VKSTFSSPVVVCRPALPCDKADVLEFTKFTWDGGDYIKYVWDHWFSDPNGGLVVAEYAGHAIGMGKLTRLSHGNWWLQGLRVASQHQDKRIGSHINDYLVQQWLEWGEGALRFLTSSERVKVHSLAERNGFVLLSERGKFSLPALYESFEVQPFTPLSEGDIVIAVEFAHRSELTGLSMGLIDLGWEYAEVSAEVLQTIVTNGEYFGYWWRDRRGLIIGWQDETRGEEKEQYLAISLVTCEISDASQLFEDFRKLAGQNGRTSVKWYAFLQPELMELLATIGFESEHKHSNYLFEKRYPSQL